MVAINTRKLMEKAIEIMRESISEPRKDGKANPLVGAVLWKPDGSIETACRGELRYGDHAEYTLLERKNRHCKLDGSILFATLEPCAPGSRRHPKLGCAERIMNARIKEVWIGIEDPDPTVDRKGIKYLQDCGILVHMFDRDLQEIIRVENREFIAQALERAAVAHEEKRKPKAILLSSLETSFKNTKIQDFSTNALKEYRSIAKITDNVASPEFNRHLLQQGLLKEENGQLVPTGFGILLFGKMPRTLMPQSGLLGTIHYPNGDEEPKDFDGPQVLAPGQALKWLKEKLPNPIDRTGARRRASNDPFFELVREGIVNALVHRNYEIKGAKCQLDVSNDIVTIKSPGGPLPPITLEQIQAFTAPMLSRNPTLHYVFAKMELAEERGLGLKSMRDRAHDLGLPLPRYSWEEPYLVLKLYLTPSATIIELGDEIISALSKSERLGWEWVVKQDDVTSTEYSNAMKVPNRTALNHLKHFVDLGLVRKVGSGRATRYVIGKG